MGAHKSGSRTHKVPLQKSAVLYRKRYLVANIIAMAWESCSTDMVLTQTELAAGLQLLQDSFLSPWVFCYSSFFTFCGNDKFSLMLIFTLLYLENVKIIHLKIINRGFPDGSDSKESACNAGDPDSIPGMGIESPGKAPWRREWLLIPEFLPGEVHEQRRLVGYSPWGCKELETSEWQAAAATGFYTEFFFFQKRDLCFQNRSRLTDTETNL